MDEEELDWHDMTSQEVALWRQMAEPPSEPSPELVPIENSSTPSETSSEDDEEAAEELPESTEDIAQSDLTIEQPQAAESDTDLNVEAPEVGDDSESVPLDVGDPTELPTIDLPNGPQPADESVQPMPEQQAHPDEQTFDLPDGPLAEIDESLPTESPTAQEESNASGELPTTVPADVDRQPEVMDLPVDDPATTTELTAPSAPNQQYEHLEIPGALDAAEMGPEGNVDSPPDSAEPVLPVDSLPTGSPTDDLPIDLPDQHSDPRLDIAQPPEREQFQIDDWTIQSRFEYGGQSRQQTGGNVIQVAMNVPDDFDQQMTKRLEPQMGMLRDHLFEQTSVAIEESAVLMGATGAPY